MDTAIHQRLSVDAFLRLSSPEGCVLELVEGELVVNPPAAPRHERLFTRLFLRLGQFVAPYSDLALYPSNAGLHFGPRTVLSPDIFIVRTPRAIHSWADCPVPLLVIEILSPSTASRDRVVKRHYYQTAGVEEYWIVDPRRRRIERWRPEDQATTIVEDLLHFTLSNGCTGSIDLPSLFEQAGE